MRKLLLATLLLSITLFASSNTSMMYDTKDPLWQKQTDLQKRLPPKKLPMVTADNKGEPLTDLTMIADRQAFLNQVTAYSFLIDEEIGLHSLVMTLFLRQQRLVLELFVLLGKKLLESL
jgi:hypothetical protein